MILGVMTVITIIGFNNLKNQFKMSATIHKFGTMVYVGVLLFLSYVSLFVVDSS